MSTPTQSLRSSQPQSDLEALLTRMRQRLYPETIPVLTSYWLKTVYAARHERAWWMELNDLLKQVLRKQVLDASSHQGLTDIQSWVEETALRSASMPSAPIAKLEPVRATPKSDHLAPYIRRLLNRWLMAEVACLLVNRSESDWGIPVLAIATSIERLLLRDRLSPATLEMLLQPDLVDPRDIYPADAEILTDVILALLGRTGAPTPPVMPATLLRVAAGFPLSQDYGEAVRHALLVQTREGDEVHVPIGGSQASEILKRDPVRIASVIVTMDGRCWMSESFQSGEQHSVIYKPRGRLRIDFSADHGAIRYFQTEISIEYGRVPWRILPAPAQTIFVKRPPDHALLQLLNQVFDGFPEAALSETTGQSSPSHAA